MSISLFQGWMCYAIRHPQPLLVIWIESAGVAFTLENVIISYPLQYPVWQTHSSRLISVVWGIYQFGHLAQVEGLYGIAEKGEKEIHHTIITEGNNLDRADTLVKIKEAEKRSQASIESAKIRAKRIVDDAIRNSDAIRTENDSQIKKEQERILSDYLEKARVERSIILRNAESESDEIRKKADIASVIKLFKQDFNKLALE